MAEPFDHPRLHLAELEMAKWWKALRVEQTERRRRRLEAAYLETLVTGRTVWFTDEPEDTDTAEALAAFRAFPFARWWAE